MTKLDDSLASFVMGLGLGVLVGGLGALYGIADHLQNEAAAHHAAHHLPAGVVWNDDGAIVP